MGGIRFIKLVEMFIAALERASATVLLQGPVESKPARLRVVSSEQEQSCEVFLWTITPGGGGEGVRPAGERRIQITNVKGPFQLIAGVRTLIGGYSVEHDAWCFWDPRRHGRFSSRSPSLQVDVDTLERAAHHGIAVQTRPSAAGAETVVAISSAYLLWYVLDGSPLHDATAEDDLVTELANPTPEVERAAIDDSETPEEAGRRHKLVEVMRAFRDARFRPAVMQAYGYKCAISGVGLKLVDAAHIVPVAHPKGTDNVTNGIALSPTYHAAFDSGLLGIRSDGGLVLNERALARLRDAHLLAGLDRFKAELPPRATFPAAIEVRPDAWCLQLGMRIREFPDSLIA